MEELAKAIYEEIKKHMEQDANSSSGDTSSR